jgi:hypothetical protein
MKQRTIVNATVADFGRDINGNRTAHFVIQDGENLQVLHSTRKRRQVGNGSQDLSAVGAFLEHFEGGEWKLVKVERTVLGNVEARYERDIEAELDAAQLAFSEAVLAYLEAPEGDARRAATMVSNAAHEELARVLAVFRKATAPKREHKHD